MIDLTDAPAGIPKSVRFAVFFIISATLLNIFRVYLAAFFLPSFNILEMLGFLLAGGGLYFLALGLAGRRPGAYFATMAIGVLSALGILFGIIGIGAGGISNGLNLLALVGSLLFFVSACSLLKLSARRWFFSK